MSSNKFDRVKQITLAKSKSHIEKALFVEPLHIGLPALEDDVTLPSQMFIAIKTKSDMKKHTLSGINFEVLEI